jgi:hypothetical protein
MYPQLVLVLPERASINIKLEFAHIMYCWWSQEEVDSKRASLYNVIVESGLSENAGSLLHSCLEKR